MFKIGDVVYCIDKRSLLNLNIPYNVIDLVQDDWLKLKGFTGIGYHSKIFISEREYQRNKRLEKITKIKNAIHK